jgi:hypothetical protein
MLPPLYPSVAVLTHREELVPLPHPLGNERPRPEKLGKIAGGVKGWGRVS